MDESLGIGLEGLGLGVWELHCNAMWSYLYFHGVMIGLRSGNRQCPFA